MRRPRPRPYACIRARPASLPRGRPSHPDDEGHYEPSSRAASRLPLRGVVLRPTGIAALVSLVLAAPAAAKATDHSLLMPGVTFTRQVEFTPHGPVVLNVINAPKPGGLYSLLPVLSNNAIVGRERVTSMEKRVSSTATVAGVNGDFFN